jgi:hypothetical protein
LKNDHNNNDSILVVERDSCPYCGQCDAGFAIGGELWDVCHRHRTRWFFNHDSDLPPERIEWTPELMKLLNYAVVQPVRDPISEVMDLLGLAIAQLERAGKYLGNPDATRLIAHCRGRVGGSRLQDEIDRVAHMATAQQAIVLRLVATDSMLEKAARAPEGAQSFRGEDTAF